MATGVPGNYNVGFVLLKIRSLTSSCHFEVLKIYVKLPMTCSKEAL